MNKVKTAAALLSVTMLLASFTGCANKNGNESDQESNGIIAATSENVKINGRTWLDGDTLWLGLSGSGIEFNYTGKKLDITLIGDGAAELAENDANYARAAVYVDGERVADEMINAPQKVVSVFESAEEKTVEVKVIKLSESSMSTFGIMPIQIADGEKIEPANEKSHRIEFIGDSITCGYGVDDEVKENHFSTATEDFTKTYAYKTAEALDAECNAFSVSGYGIISGYTSNGKKSESQIIPKYYDSLGFSYNSFAKKSAPQTLEWDFSQFKPEVIVINLGTNDASYCGNDAAKQEEYTKGYIEFLKHIREKNPDSRILCTLGIMGDSLYPAMENACLNYIDETGDKNISAMRFNPQDGSLGFAADWHPTDATHSAAAEQLTTEIKNIMGW